MKFVATGELGRLVRWLRLLGYDVAYYAQSDMGGAVAAALHTRRILLTRQGRIQPSQIIRIVQVKGERVEEQLRQLRRLGLIRTRRPLAFDRCNVCNMPLRAVTKARVRRTLPAFTFRTQQRFSQCPTCRRVYWPGSHWARVTRMVKRL